ncbi:MAG: PQQ-binding-like beta-propeller repeat protein [Candidatus Saliniplasma sp.]
MFKDNIGKTRILKIFTIFLIASVILSIALLPPYAGDSVEEMWRAEIGQQWRKEEGVIYASTPNERGLIALDVKGNEMWRYHPDNSIDDIGNIRHLLMGKDGNVHVIYNSTATVTVVTVNSNGQEIWSLQIEGYESSSPAIAEDGTIYFILNGGRLISIGPDGSQRWYYETGPLFNRAPIIGDDDTIYIISGKYYIHAINPNGTYKWKISAGFPVMVKNDIIYYVDTPEPNTGMVVALDSDGDEIWRHYFQEPEIEGYYTRISLISLSIEDDDIYITGKYCRQETDRMGIAPCPGPYWGVIRKLDPEGRRVWNYTFPLGGAEGIFIPRPLPSRPVFSDDSIFIGGWNGRDRIYSIHTINTKGEVKQSFQISDLENIPIMDEQGGVYVYESNNLYSYNSEGEVKWEFTAEGELEPHKVLRDDSSIFFRCSEGHLYAVKEEKNDEVVNIGLVIPLAIIGITIGVIIYHKKS